MSQLHSQFNYSLCQASPIIGDVCRTVNVDDDGIEHVTFPSVDYLAIVRSNGSVSDWSLSGLLKAGINPSFPIATGLNTRIEGVSVIQQASAIADSLLSENSNE